MAANSTSPNAHLAVPSAEWAEFHAKAPPGRVIQLIGTPEEMRENMAWLKASSAGMVPAITEGLTVRDTDVPMSDGSTIAVRIYNPAAAGDTSTTALPCLVYFHGGGWTLGDLEGEDTTCRRVCVSAGIMVVSVDYRLAPEHPFPTCVDDTWDALVWTIKNSEALGIDKDSIIVGGSSSGANLAAVIANRALDRGIALKGQVLRIPSVCHIDCYPPELNLHSVNELKDAPILSRRSLELFWGYYNPPDPRDPDASPLLRADFHGLAPAYMQVAGMDPLRDEGLAYSEKLKSAGVTIKLDIYPGLPHAFGYFPEISASAQNTKDLIAGIQFLLGRA